MHKDHKQTGEIYGHGCYMSKKGELMIELRYILIGLGFTDINYELNDRTKKFISKSGIGYPLPKYIDKPTYNNLYKLLQEEDYECQVKFHDFMIREFDRIKSRFFKRILHRKMNWYESKMQEFERKEHRYNILMYIALAIFILHIIGYLFFFI